MTDRATPARQTMPLPQAGWLQRLTPLVWTAICCVGLGLYLIVQHLLGAVMNGDADDLLKLYEVRTFLQAGNVFDRTLPDILQPEAYVTHWPWIVDLPYALVAWAAMPFTGFETAITFACWTVPLMLLIPAMFLYARLVRAAGFSCLMVALPLAVFRARAGFVEFAPERIDYHNLQILLLFATIAALLSTRRWVAFCNGLLIALSMAISLEFALFQALAMGVYASDFVFRKGGGARLRCLGAGLMVGALALLAATARPADYLAIRCDTYSAPYALALALAGLSFVLLPKLNGGRGRAVRAGGLAVLALASAAAVAAYSPQCLAGPYSGLDAKLREAALGHILQEMSLFRRPDYILSGNLPSVLLLFIGALAPATLLLVRPQRSRGLVLVALFALLALVQAVAYFRYLRYLSFFSGIGLTLVVAAVLTPRLRRLAGLDIDLPPDLPRRAGLMAPGAALTAALVVFHLIRPSAELDGTAVELAAICYSPGAEPRTRWPDGAVALLPPSLGVELVAQPSHPAVVAIPNHPAAHGIERVDRFFDPQTSDPRAVLDETGATLVGVCAWDGGLAERLQTSYPLAFTLMRGQSPDWLKKCPDRPGSSLNIYRYDDGRGSGENCPVLADTQ